MAELLPAGKSREELTFKDYQQVFYSYWAPFNVLNDHYEVDGINVKAAGYKQFKRWEWLQATRTSRHRNIPYAKCLSNRSGTNANGPVVLQIGRGNVAIGEFDDIDWEASPYFLKGETDT